jgi:4-amino-4-deoxy-L-arabinose transferase-like glycosyltransferase
MRTVWSGGVLPALVLCAVAAGVLLRLHGMEAQSLSFDEGATDYFAHLPFADLWGKPAWLETNPPLYYTMERGTLLLFGNDVATLRLVSVIAGALCIPMAAFIAYLAGGPAASLASAALVATSTASIASSQDARTYSVLTLVALVAIAAVFALVRSYCGAERSGRRVPLGAWVSYVLASVAALYLHNTAFLMVLTLNLVAALCWLSIADMPRRFATHWIAANAFIVAAYVPWLPVVAYQSANPLTTSWIPVPKLADLRYEIMNAYAQPFMHALQPLPDLLFLVVGLAGTFRFRSNRFLLGLAIFVVLGVPVLTWVISQWRPLTNGKTLLWLVPVFLIFVALGSTWHRRLAIPFTSALVALQLVACYSYFQTRSDDRFPEMAQLLRTYAQDGDAIYLHAPPDELMLQYYGWPRERLLVYAPGPVGWFRSYSGSIMTAADFEQADHTGRVWVFTRNNREFHRSLVQHLSAKMTAVFERSLSGLELSLLQPRSAPAPTGEPVPHG